jgi:hypothetical protein
VETAETLAEKLPVAEFAGTVTVEGTLTAALLLPRLTVNPPLAAAAFSATEHASVPAPVMEELVQEIPVRTGTPVPVRLTAVESVESLPTVNCPVEAPAAVGSNCTVKEVEEPGFKVMGKVDVETVKPAPVTVAELMVTAAAPVEVTVKVCVAAVFTATLPKAKLVPLRVSEGLATSTSTSVLSETPPAEAVSVTA